MMIYVRNSIQILNEHGYSSSIDPIVDFNQKYIF